MILFVLLAALAPPVAKRVPHPQTIHGVTLQDDYFWLRSKGAKDVVAYLNAENAYTRAVTEADAALRATLLKEMRARVEEDAETPPYRYRGYWYYQRELKGKQYPLICRKGEDGKETVLLDVNALAKGKVYFDVEDYQISDDSQLMAYLEDTTGFRQYVLRVKDLKTGKVRKESVERVTSVAFAADASLYYVTEDAQTKRSDKLFHAGKLIYEEQDERFSLSVERSRSGAYVFATSLSATTSDVRIVQGDVATVLRPRKQDVRYDVDHAGDRFFIRINDTGRNFRLVSAAVSQPTEWTELVAHRDDVMIEDVLAFERHLVRFERKNGLEQIVIDDRVLPQPDAVYSLAVGPNYEPNATELRYRYRSLKTPTKHMTVAFDTLATRVLQQNAVPTYDENRYETKRLTAVAKDGVEIPISLVYKKGTPQGAPVLLAAYGAYGDPFPLFFSQEIVSLLDRGVVYAVAHVRGGGDLGKRWHDDGRMMNKLNTFTDFIAVAESLKREHSKIAITGESAGGLTMGAVLNMRPELFSAALVYVPFVDVINTMLDETLPLVTDEYEEWGNPKEKPAFEYMLKYSPYDNVAKTAYPAMLVVSAYNDSQVMYWEPAKWVAKLRATQTGTRPVLLRMAMEPAGHGGASGRYDQLADRALEFAFVLQALAQ